MNSVARSAGKAKSSCTRSAALSLYPVSQRACFQLFIIGVAESFLGGIHSRSSGSSSRLGIAPFYLGRLVRAEEKTVPAKAGELVARARIVAAWAGLTPASAKSLHGEEGASHSLAGARH